MAVENENAKVIKKFEFVVISIAKMAKRRHCEGAWQSGSETCPSLLLSLTK